MTILADGRRFVTARTLFCTKQLRKLLQFVEIQIGDRPERHALAGPVDEVKALVRRHPGAGIACAGGKNEEVYRMQPPRVNKRRDRTSRGIVETASSERKALRPKIGHRRRIVELPVKPRLDRVLVRLCNVRQMIHHHRPHVVRYKIIRDQIVRRWLRTEEHEGKDQQQYCRDREARDPSH